jgi:hypothetical protein
MRDLMVSLAECLAAASREGVHDQMKKNPPFDRCYWVVPGKLLAGYYPGDPDRDGTIAKLGALLDTGIRAFIDLTEEMEFNRWGMGLVPYEEDLRQVADDKGIPGVSYRRMPIPDLGVRTKEAMREILDTIDWEMDNGRPVYVHCLGGIGRTRTVVGCWLARHGVASAEAVLDRIAELRSGDPSAEVPSPETRQQRNLVRRWKAGEQKARCTEQSGSAAQRLFNPLGLMLQAVRLSRGFHPGLFCSTPLGWLPDHSHGGLAVTMRINCDRRWRPYKGRIEEPGVQTLGRGSRSSAPPVSVARRSG